MIKIIRLAFKNLLFFSLLPNVLYGQSHSLRKIWENDSLITPESALFSKKGNLLFISNINGKPDAKDGNGFISTVSSDGSLIKKEWVIGLDAPKGMARYKNTLYVADIKDMVIIDIPTAKVTNRVTIDSAVFLNDVTVDDKGVVYVSDTRTGKVHELKNGKATTFLSKLDGPNGLLAVDTALYILDKGKLLKTGPSKSLQTLVVGMEASTDGIEQVSPGEFLVSAWIGVVYYVKADGTKETLLDTRQSKSNTADIGYNPKKKIVYVPTFYKNSIIAYELK